MGVLITISVYALEVGDDLMCMFVYLGEGRGQNFEKICARTEWIIPRNLLNKSLLSTWDVSS